MARPCAFSPNPRHARKLARFYAEMFPPGAVVVDLGFGRGEFLEAGRERGLRPVGIDRDASLVADASARGFNVSTADVRDLSSLAGPIDGAVAAHIIEHLEPDEVKGMLAGLAEKLRPGGLFVGATPNMGDPRVAGHLFWADPTHVRPYPVEAIAQLADPAAWELAADGFEPMSFTRMTPRVLLERLRFGGQYGKPGRWFRFVRR
jgi:2-polyprenyl-3-methyl-5-hydroxy-6-metoxy-1,4-benzoquinol methylase